MIKQSALKKIGNSIKTHGISGEILCEFFIDFDNDNFPQYLILEDDGIFVPFFVEEYRRKANSSTFFVKFCRISDEETARTLCKKTVFYDKKIDFDIEKQNFGTNILIGYRLVDEAFGVVGTIDDIDESTVNVLFVTGERLIPAAPEFILRIDQKTQTIFTRLPVGLLEL
jgi:16S rRNA processing protein RimM